VALIDKLLNIQGLGHFWNHIVAKINKHIENTDNPHKVTLAKLGFTASDYEQYDSNALDFIKNKPFYSVTTELYNDKDKANKYNGISVNFDLEVGKNYVVSINETEYRTVCKETTYNDSEAKKLACGDYAIYIANGLLYFTYPSGEDNASVTLKIVLDDIKKIDRKYVPSLEEMRSENVVVLPETQGEPIEEDGAFILPYFALIDGKPYSVVYNGVEYISYANRMGEDGTYLGNLGALDPTFENTGEPFLLFSQAEMICIASFDGAETVKVSIAEKNYRPIPLLCLANALPYYIEATCSQREDGQFDVYVSETVAEVTELMRQGREIRVRLSTKDSEGRRTNNYFYMVTTVENQGMFALLFQCADNPFEANGDRASRLIFTPNLDGSYSIADTPW
jgi:hypothetical protein